MREKMRIFWYGSLGIAKRVRQHPVTQRWKTHASGALHACALLLLLWFIFTCFWTPRYFISYVPRDHFEGMPQSIAAKAEAYLAAHPSEACVSSLELSVHDDHPFHHVVVRTDNANKRADGHFLSLLNPVFVVDESTTDSAAAGALSRVTAWTRGDNNVARDVTYRYELPAPPLQNKAPGWVQSSEANTFCDYVYHHHGGWITWLLQWFWPNFALHTNDVPKTNALRATTVRVRFRDIATFAWMERTLTGTAAVCVQHYNDVYSKKLRC